MNSIDTRTPFFPNSKTGQKEIQEAKRAKQAQMLKRNSMERAQQLNDIATRDAKVTIPDTIKDFSKIKKIADTSEPVDNSDKIASLRAQIQAGTYQPDYEAIADKMLESDF